MSDGPGTVEVTPALLRQWPLPAHQSGQTKQQRGHVVVVGGSAQTPGAVRLAAVAALRVGAGKLSIATVASTAAALAVAVLEALVQSLPETGSGGIDPAAADLVVSMGRAGQGVLIGPGMSGQEACCSLVIPVLRQLGHVAVALDALGLAALEQEVGLVRNRSAGAVLTPNRDELGYMLGRDEDGIDDAAAGPAAAAAAQRFGAVVSLGGGESLIAHPDGRLWRESAGSIGLGVSGSGNSAAGVVAGLLARGAEPAQAAVWAAHLHGPAGDRLAARIGRIGYLAREVAEEIPQVLSEYQ